MKIILEWEDESIVLTPDKTYVLGRGENSDIIIAKGKVSRSHLKVYFENNTWLVVDLNSTHGTYQDGKRIGRSTVKEDTYFNLGGPNYCQISFRLLNLKNKFEEGQKIESYEQTKVIEKPSIIFDQSSSVKRIKLKSKMRIGRDKSNDWQIDNINVSRVHAEISQNRDKAYEILDLGSKNGTFVNGNRIRRITLKIGDQVSIGNSSRIFTQDGLELLEGIEGSSLSVKNVSFSYSGKEILKNISFDLRPSTLTAIVGPSGAGKSTLLGILNGTRKPSLGTVTLGNIDLNKSRNMCMRQIGFVPQADIIHSKLTTKQALNYGALLRLPRDLQKDARINIVNEVLSKLELTERANLRIDKLSGGQRKRASIGLELLNSPEILILDEPTSGLDPALETHIMRTLRSLADQGQTVAVVTHSVESLDLCDNVILLAAGGRIAYIGPSSAVFSSFNCTTWSEVFKKLTETRDLNFVVSVEGSSKDRTNYTINSTSSTSRFIETMTLAKRYFQVISADSFYLSLLVLIPIIMGAISYFADSDYGFGPGKLIKENIYSNPYAKGTILLLILGSIFIGLSTSIQEIIKEEQIRKRESNAGISSGSYIASKIIVLSFICVLQILIFSNIVLLGRPLPNSGLLFNSSKFEILLICSALVLCSMLLGLMVSSLMSSTEQTMPSLIGLTMILVVLSGALPLENSNVITTLGKLVPSSWATNALASSIDLIQLTLTKIQEEQIRWEYSFENIIENLNMLGLFAIIYISVTYISLRKKN